MTSRKEIAQAIAGNGHSAREIETILKAAERHIALTLMTGEIVTLSGFGSFAAVVSPAHPGRNPRTGEPIEIPDGVRVPFHPHAELKRLLAPLVDEFRQAAAE